jgi:endonuclease/exonuclease/phosphatase (EEP) superfamily protein YafD
MSSTPQTRPETWVPAGTEKREGSPSTLTEPQAGRRKPRVALPPRAKQPRKPLLRHARKHATNLAWALFAAAIPWLWFVVRDLGPIVQLVALALPALVAAALVGLVISALDERKLSSLIVTVSVVAFGWVTLLGPRSALPPSQPVNPLRVASITLDGSTLEGSSLDASAIVGSLAKQKADIALVVEPSKKARNLLLRADRFPYTMTSGRYVVLSTIPVTELPLQKGLPTNLIVRLQVDRQEGTFIIYAVRAGTSPLDAAQDDPIGIEQLRDAARGERLPVVLAGDFGISDRSTQYRTLTDSFRDAMRSGTRAASTAATFPWTFLYLRTAFVLTSPDWCAAGGSTFEVQDATNVGLVTGVGACRR